MINGNVQEFVDHVRYGDELWFLYDGQKYFLEGWSENGALELCLYEMRDGGRKYIWKGISQYPANDFLSAPIWNGRVFWDAEQDMTWIDC